MTASLIAPKRSVMGVHSLFLEKDSRPGSPPPALGVVVWDPETGTVKGGVPILLVAGPLRVKRDLAGND